MPEFPTDIIQIRIATPFDMGPANVWLITGEVPTLIDMGIDMGDAMGIMEREINNAGLGLTDIQQILCTHGHEDHVGNVANFMDRHEVPVYLHPDDHIKLTANMGGPPWMRWVDQIIPLYRQSGMPESLYALMLSAHRESFHDAMGIGYRSYANPLPLREGDRFRAGDRELTVVETPGHAPGQVCFLDERAGFLFAGDQVLDKISPNPIIEYFEGPRYHALPHYAQSLRRVATLPIACTCAGHGPPIWDTDRVIREYFDLFDVRLEFTHKYLQRQPRTAFDVTKHVYKHANDFAIFPAFNAAIGLLDVLAERNEIQEYPGEDGLLYWRATEGV